MHIALVHDRLTGTGYEEKVLLVLMELFPGAELFTLAYWPERMDPEFEKRKIITSALQRLPFGKTHPQAFAPLYWGLTGGFDLSSYDLIVSSSSACSKWVRNPQKALHVCYFHKPMDHLWDGGELGVENGLGRFETRLFRKYLQECDLKSNEGVTHFLTGSVAMKDRIKELYSREAEVIAPPLDAKFSFRVQVYFRRLFGISTIPDNDKF
jgi:hypothetical protein